MSYVQEDTTTIEGEKRYKSSHSYLNSLFQTGSVIVALYFIIYAIYIYQNPRAFSSYSISALMNNTAPLALAAAGQTFVIITRGFDLSVAGVISICNVVLAVYPLEGPFGALISLLICLFIGVLVGAINGVLVAYLRIQSIAATLGTMIICQGIALLILNAPGGRVADWLSYEMTGVLFGFIPISGLFVLCTVFIWLFVRRTKLGISIFAIGADENSADLSGIKSKRARCYAFILAGAFYGFAGFMLSAQTATGDPTSGNSFLLLTFAAVALGGTPFSGGKGSLVFSVVGAATLMLIQKVLFSSGVSSFYTGIFQGCALIFAVALSSLVDKLGQKIL